ncbi:Crp/Fnr family transcriptional regulator [Sphingobacterium faecium]|uniref:Crp/Fnr family transcriptional regulator n=1 Tax=Sphingobacterium faecium TaxID=34087 RepID=UPI0012927DF3|nr:Crp/Fnr family transcriptional regulator [Sphingobacterium faecium]
MNDIKDKLRTHIEKIISLTDDEFSWIYEHFTVQEFKKNELIFEEGQPVKHVYFVLSGLVVLSYTDRDAKQHLISFAMEDWWETDFVAFYSKSRSTFALKCIENTKMLCLTLDHFEKLCATIQKMEHFFLKKSIAGHIGSQQRILSFLTSSAKQRYEHMITNHPALVQRIPKSMLASYLGVSRETLSRIL